MAGGKINFKQTKTYTRIMKWVFNPDVKHFMMPQSSYQRTVIKLPDNLHIKVHTVSPYTATIYLGIWQSMYLTDTAHITKLQTKHKTFDAALSASPVTPYEALHLFQTVYFSQISFSLSSTSFRPKEIKKLQSKIIVTLLRKLHLPHTFPRVIVYAPTSHMGI